MIGAVDIGGTKIAVGMVTESGQVLSRKESPTDAGRYVNGLATIAGLLRETAQIAGVEITGIGIGSTGPVDPFTGKFGEVDFLPGWRGQNPVEDLARIFHVPVALENDADAAGPLCSCGFRGCWESLAAGPAMVAWLDANAPADYPQRDHLTAKRICQLARQDDALAQQAVERE